MWTDRRLLLTTRPWKFSTGRGLYIRRCSFVIQWENFFFASFVQKLYGVRDQCHGRTQSTFYNKSKLVCYTQNCTYHTIIFTYKIYRHKYSKSHTPLSCSLNDQFSYSNCFWKDKILQLNIIHVKQKKSHIVYVYTLKYVMHIVDGPPVLTGCAYVRSNKSTF